MEVQVDTGDMVSSIDSDYVQIRVTEPTNVIVTPDKVSVYEDETIVSEFWFDNGNVAARRDSHLRAVRRTIDNPYTYPLEALINAVYANITNSITAFRRRWEE